MEKSKQFILDLIAADQQTKGRRNLRQLSRELGKNDAYLQQYIHRGSPRVLPERTRYQLAAILGTDEHYLRESYWQADSPVSTLPPIQSIPLLEPEAGNPFLLQYFARQDLLKLVATTDLEHLRIAIIEDDSMAPDMPAGTHVMINLADRNLLTPAANNAGPTTDDIAEDSSRRSHSESRMFLFRYKGGSTLRFASEHSTSDQTHQLVRLTASNPAYGTIRIAKTNIQPIGRVIWYARRLI